MRNNFLKSPLNYMGGKYGLLSQILPLFPQKIEVFVDLFCGGGNVGINVDCKKVVFNDSSECIVKLFESWKKTPSEILVKSIMGLIKKFGLSETSKFGYGFYGCDSLNGLAKYNREPFAKLKSELNRKKNEKSYTDYLFVAILYAFNNQIRFNSKGNFNLPVGKRDFNKVEREKLLRFVNKLHQMDCVFSSSDFKNFDYSKLTKNDFVYADPPYLMTNAFYNESKQWTDNEEKMLLMTLDKLNEIGVRFALSNVLETKGMKNVILASWIRERPNLKCHHLIKSYSNSNYQRKGRNSFTDEVLIINY